MNNKKSLEEENNDSFTFSFLSDDVLTTSLSSMNVLKATDDINNTITNITTTKLVNDFKLQANRFNYKCKYCDNFLTKFKAHIIEHMQLEHNIYLMQCPEISCQRRFKDEWKLKRHLLSNREHQPLSQFKNFNDVMQSHVNVSHQKIGFLCPLCQIDQTNNNDNDQTLIIVSDDLNSINDIKKSENYLYFSTYDELKEHITAKHTNLDINTYFICKNCGQNFQNRYKLSCHLFNVHSGKRKSRKKQPILTIKTNETQLFNNNNNEQLIDFHIQSVIDSVANGLIVPEDKIKHSDLESIQQQQQQQLLKINCMICNKKFKRIRDINSHIKIMHKNLTDLERKQQDDLLEMHKKLLKLNKKKLLKSQLISTNLLTNSGNNIHNESKNIKVCFVCNKIFKENLTNSTTVNKTFIRHMQIQHGLNEKGERLIECPVCEKNFFNRQQMERHMHVHEVWIDIIKQDQNNSNASMYVSSIYCSATPPPPIEKSESDIKLENNNNEKLDVNDYRDKHSILYCHECIDCNVYFKSIKVLTKHKKIIHNLKPVYRCANSLECNKEFELVSSFLEHSKLHPQKNIMCSRCKIKFSNKNLLRHHMKNVHYNRKIQTSFIKKSSPAATTATNVQNQQQQQHITIRNLQYQQQQIQTNQELITLNNKTSVSPNSVSSLTSNSSAILDEPTTFCCPTCKNYFSSRNSLHNHLATHTNTDLRLFLCNTCGHSFKTKKDLSRHASLHDTTKHKTCHECGMLFKTSFHLKRHSLTRHSNIKPFKCNQCDMQFARKDKLKQHEAKHINHPLYQCTQCSKGFYRKEHLKDHIISKHSKQYPFSCEHCSKGFVHAKDLHRHIRVRHLGVAVNQTTIANTNISNNLIKKVKIKANTLKITNPFQATTAPTTTSAQSTQPVSTIISNNNNNNNTTMTPVKLTSNDFKSKKISSILKSTLINLPSSNTTIDNNNSE